MQAAESLMALLWWDLAAQEIGRGPIVLGAGHAYQRLYACSSTYGQVPLELEGPILRTLAIAMQDWVPQTWGASAWVSPPGHVAKWGTLHSLSCRIRSLPNARQQAVVFLPQLVHFICS